MTRFLQPLPPNENGLPSSAFRHCPIGDRRRLGYSSRDIDRRGRKEATMADPARRARLLRDLEQDFLPDYDAQSMPSADKRAAYALEHIAFRVGRIEQTLAKIATALETVLAKL
jgi:hypothetical protein